MKTSSFLVPSAIIFASGTVFGFLVTSWVGMNDVVDSALSAEKRQTATSSGGSSSSAQGTWEMSSPSSGYREHLSRFSRLFDVVPSEDYATLLIDANQLRDPAHRLAMSQVLMAQWAKRDPEAALAYLTDTESGTGTIRQDVLPMVLKEYAAADGKAALAWAEANLKDGSIKPYVLPAIYAGMATRDDPRNVIAMAGELPPGPMRDNAMSAVIREWAEYDINGVFDWIEAQPLNPSLYQAYSAVMFDFVDQNPAKAATVILEMRDGELKGQLSDRYTQQVAQEQGVEQALQWAESLENEQLRHNATWVALDAWARNDPAEALDYALEFFQEDQYTGLLRQLSHNLARVNPEKLASKIDHFPDHAQASSSAELARYWFREDPAAAETWLNKITDDGVKKEVSRVAIAQFINSQPSKAFEIAASQTTDEHLALASQVINRWYQVDPDSALAAVKSAGQLSEQQKSMLLDQVSSNDVVDILLP